MVVRAAVHRRLALHPGRRRAARSHAASLLAPALLAALLVACTDDGMPPTPVATPPAAEETTAATTGTATSPPANETPAGTPGGGDTGTAVPPAGGEWPAPAFGIPPLDAAIGALRAGDADALLALVEPATAECTTAQGAGGPPKCPAGIAHGTQVEYFPYFECDGWGSEAAARERMMDESNYALAALAYEPPVAARVTDDATIRHALVLARAGFGADAAGDDSRLLTTLAFDEDGIPEITGDCGAYSQDAFEGGDLPEFDEADVIWRRYPAGD